VPEALHPRKSSFLLSIEMFVQIPLPDTSEGTPVDAAKVKGHVSPFPFAENEKVVS
jgi:hypothetical protein